LEERLVAIRGSAPGQAAVRVFTLVARKPGEYELPFELTQVRDPTPLSRHVEHVSIVER
jgi:hypothetical protein